MKIGLIVDGESELKSLPFVVGAMKLGARTCVWKPILAKMTPLAPLPVLVRGLIPSVRQLEGRAADRIVVLVDRESRTECSCKIASELNCRLRAITDVDTAVVVKDRMYENWLVADCEALAGQPRRFNLTGADRNRIVPDRADSVDGLAIIKRACVGASYNKVQDSQRIMQRADPLRAAFNSRSFRRLLRVLGHEAYRRQSRIPVSRDI